jgi:RimJ/RimL family protein N-acetyltransferase
MSSRLVRLSGRHARELASLAAGEPTARRPPAAFLDGRDGVLGFLERAQRLRARGVQETFAVREADRLVGLAVLTRDERRPEHGELGYWVAVAYRGRGHATAAARALLAHGFERMRLDTIVARSGNANRASVRVLEKAGFRPVGVEPAADDNDPVGRYEIHREEWLARR